MATAPTVHDTARQTPESCDSSSDASNSRPPSQRHARSNISASAQQNQPSRTGASASASSGESNLRHALTIKRDQVFLLTTQTGDIHKDDPGYGIFYRDTCYLDQMELLVAGRRLIPLLADAGEDDAAEYELTNGRITLSDGDEIEQSRLSVRRAYQIAETITQTVEIHNFDSETHTIEVAFRMGSRFADMLVLRGFLKGAVKRGVLHTPKAQGHTLTFRYDGADNHTRITRVTFSPASVLLDEHGGTYTFALKPGQTRKLTLNIRLEDVDHEHEGKGRRHTPHIHCHAQAKLDETLGAPPVIRTSLPRFDDALHRALEDMRMLATSNGTDVFTAAGAPWYVALFGRDSCIAAYEMLAFYPQIARATLDLLARYQGSQVNDYRDEEPGKILHELRVGESAHLHEAPMTPYYGTVDATPWFLLLLHAYVKWSGDMELFERLQTNVERALGWMKDNCAGPIKGYLSYGSRAENGLVNQGWKDSSNGVVNANGTLVQPPIALVEAQAYAYAAYCATAELYRLAEDGKRASELERRAADLRHRFNHDFWISRTRYYAFTIERNGAKSGAVASNPGQALFTGIVDEEKVAHVVKRLMADDMYSGWGIRTLSSEEVAYNPLDYQVGSVWPHDNALIALGLKRCGFIAEMERVFTGIFEAAVTFPKMRLPELFDGFSRKQYAQPVEYPRACSPQAWAAGALPLMLQTALGLEPDGPSNVLHIRKPRLPAWLDTVDLRGLRVGESAIDLSFQRDGDATLVAIPRHTSDIEVVVEY